MRDIRDILGGNVRLYRKKRGWSQTELAERAHISLNYVSDIETGKRWPFPETLYNIAQGLNLEVYELFMPEWPACHTAGETIAQYHDDTMLIIKKSYASLEQSIAALRIQYETAAEPGG